MSVNKKDVWGDFFKESLIFLGYMAAVFSGVLAIEWLISVVPAASSRPVYSSGYIFRTISTAVICLGGIVFFLKMNQAGRSRYMLTSGSEAVSQWPDFSLTPRKRTWALGAVVFFSVYYLSVFFYDEHLFRDLSSDEKLVENLSAIFSFVASVISLIVGVRFFRSRLDEKKIYGVLACFFSLIFFVICMEETGWGHGIFFFEPPEYLTRGNSQGEMNIHNHATYHFELAYYFSTFVFFVVLPFFNDFRTKLKTLPVLSFFIPSRLLVYVGAMAMAYNYDMWNNLIFQMSFFVTVGILGYYTFFEKSDGHQKILVVIFLLFLLTQLSFLMFGYRVDRTPSFKEYKEFFIPLTFLIYALELFVRSKQALVRGNL